MSSTNNTCAICLDGLASRPIGTAVPCGHCFHESCFQDLYGSRCPTCNQQTTGFCRLFLDLAGSSSTMPPPESTVPDCTTNGGNTMVLSPRARTSRRNNAKRATFPNRNLDHPFAEGSFRLVAKGTYVDGDRQEQAAVCKWFKTGHVMESTFYAVDIKAMEQAVALVALWNQEQILSQMVKVNIPEVWTFESGTRWEGCKALVEPYIENYVKFNSNTGWADTSTPWPLVMQALSHYSFHVSGGEFLLCDLQGGVYSNSVVLTDPVILSKSKSFGVTDLGPRGISSFFSKHVCNQYCQDDWRKPDDQTGYYAAQRGTSMMQTGHATNMPPPPRVLRR